jgi:hypothetical protein
MHSSIKNPIKWAKRRINRDARRTRPSYPAVPAGERSFVIRLECGTTRRFLPVDPKTGRSPTMPLEGEFIFLREMPKPSRSRYLPHVGNKQAARA